MQASMATITPALSPTAPRTALASPARELMSADVAFSGRSKKAASWRSSARSMSTRRRVARRWPATPKPQPCAERRHAW